MRELLATGWTWDDDAARLIASVGVLWLGILALGAWATVRASRAANRSGRV